MTAPSLIVLDVNETLSDLGPLADRFADIGLPREAASTWFSSVLRDGMALAVAGEAAAFADIGRAVLSAMLVAARADTSGTGGDAVEAGDHVLEGFTSLGLHDDVVPALRTWAEHDVQVVTLSNGAASVAEGLLERNGARDLVSAVLSVADAGVWKPAGAAYRHALEATGRSAAEAMLVAVHPWDIDGASRAGLRTGWVSRSGGPYPAYFRAADLAAASLGELAEATVA